MEQSDSRQAVYRMKEYINKHMYDSITLKELAIEAGYSMYHSAHIFKEIAGKAPFEYIRLND